MTLTRDLDDRMSPGCTDVLARLHPLIAKPLAFGDADPPDRGFLVEFREIARHGTGGTFLGEKSEPQ